MSGNTFEVVFSGKLVEGAVEERVKANVAALFKVEVAKIERLFTGSPVVIKKAVDEATAKKYQLALHKAGAICRVVDAAAPPVEKAAPAAVPPAAAAVAAQKPTAALADEGEELLRSVVKAAPADLSAFSDVSVDEPGITLIAHQEVPVPEVDVSAISMAEVGVTLVEQEEVVAPQVDTSGLSMGEPGEILTETEQEPPLEVDTGGMTLDEPGVILIEGEEVEEPKIDISHLTAE